MPLDESSLRKAASWQDFKEAQSLLNIGAVTESEKTDSGWRGSVRVGTRIYRATVTAKTPTWFDAKCSCPGNQREGTFCPHAIATGLHLISPPPAKSVPEPPSAPAANELPAIGWKIRFQGPWQISLEKGHAAIALSPSDHEPTPADARLTAWLITGKAAKKPSIQLALNPKTLPEFLDLLQNHPQITAGDEPLSINSGAQLQLEDCVLKNETVTLIPASHAVFHIGDSLWKVTAGSLSKIGDEPLPPKLLPLADGHPVHLPLDNFLKRLPQLQSSLDFTASEWFEALQFIPESPDILLNIEGSSTLLSATLYLSHPRELPRLEGNTVITSNPAAEAAAVSRLTASGCTRLPDGRFQIEDVRTFLTRTLKSLPESWDIRLSPQITKLASSYVFISPKIQIHDSNSDWLSFDLSFQADDGTVIPTAEIRRLLRSSGNQFNGKQIILSEDIENLIDPIFEDLDLRQENGRFTAKKASAAIIEEISAKLKNGSHASPAQVLPELPLPPIQAKLRPYQHTGFSWLINRLDRYQGALLADDMGLGKTLQTITAIEHLLTTSSQPGLALIVVTTSLLGNWQAEFSRYAPGRKVVILHGPKRDTLREKIRPGDVVLTTYSTLARDLAWHLQQEYAVAVIDEASLIRNPDTDHSKAVAKLNAAKRIALTGTPVENSARDLWSIFRFIQPGWLGGRKDFEERYEVPLKSPETAPRASQLLRLKTSPFVLRRTKLEVAPELPSKILINEFCELSNDQLATYRELLKEGRRRIDEIRDSGQPAAARMQTLTTLLRLRQTCCDLALFDSEKLKSLPIPRRSGKLERLLEISEQSIASGSKLLVFSQFQKQLVQIETQLTAIGISSLRLDGSTRNRQALVDEFQTSAGPPVFLISLKAGGYGLNLTAADVVVHFDPWWNPAAEAQATDRAHRIGQTKPVTVYRLLTRGTVEEKVVQLQSHKKALAESLDETLNTTDAPAWSAADLRQLLQ